MHASTHCLSNNREAEVANKLEITLPSDREIRITRKFDAPRNLVWDCHTKPELVRRWLLGPPGWEMPVCEIDLRVGGKYRYEWLDTSRGKTMGMDGVFTDVSALVHLGSREKFDDDWTGGETRVSQAFARAGTATTVTLTVAFASLEARDNAARSGMTDGMEQGYARLDEVLATLA
jgi:uncharacterized protein YndB with AHSA1/START domain